MKNCVFGGDLLLVCISIVLEVSDIYNLICSEYE